MRTERTRTEYKLTGETVDQIAAQVEAYLYSLKLERANVFRIRLSMEEALLRWLDHFGEGAAVTLELGVTLLRPTITLELAGAGYDPFTNAENDLGVWANSLLWSIGLTPQYSYRYGVNIVQIKLKRPRLNPALTLLVALILGTAIGLLGRFLLPETIRAVAQERILDPIRYVFFRILNAAAGPVMFLSLLAAICGGGSMAAMNKSGRRLIVRFLLLSTVMAVIAAALALLLMRPGFSAFSLDGTRFQSALDFFLQIVPGDILTPFIEGDTPQLILLAILLGNALLALGSRVDGFVSLVEQMNSIALLIAEWVSRLTPFFVTALLILGIWSSSLRRAIGIWKPLLLFVLLSAALLFIRLLIVSRKEEVPVKKLAVKLKSSFLVAFKNASVDTAYGINRLCCLRRLGINQKLVDFGLPLGLVIYMPAGTVAAMILTIYAAQMWGVTLSFLWLIMALFMTVTLLAATPPVAGVGLLTYAVMFTRLGIPTDALTTAMVVDILFGFGVSAVNQAMLQLELVLEADRLSELNRSILRQ